MKKYILLIFAALFTVNAQSQSVEKIQQTVDSLKNRLNIADITDEDKQLLYLELCKKCMDFDGEQLSQIANEGLLFAKKKKSTMLEANMLRYKGLHFSYKHKTDSAMAYYTKALTLIESKDNKDDIDYETMVEIMHSIGILYYERGDYNKTIDYFIDILHLCENIKEKESIVSSMYGELATLFVVVNDYGTAEDYFLKAIEMSKMPTPINKETRLYCMNNLAVLYKKKKQIDKSLNYGMQALELADTLKNYQLIVGSCHNIGNCYIEKGDLNTALEYAERAEKVATSLKLSEITTVYYKMLYCAIYLKMKKYDKAIEYGEDAYAIGNTINDQGEIAEYLAMAYIGKGDSRNAEKYFMIYKKLSEDLMEQTIHNSIINAERKYKTEKKELQIQGLNKQQRLYRKYITAGSIAVLLLVCTIILGILIMRRQKIRAAEKIKQLEQEKKLLAAQALLDGENQERTRLSQELHDGLGGLLTMLKLNLEQMKEHLQSTRSEIDKTIELTNKSIFEMRNLAHSIMPDVLQHSSLNESLAEFCSTSPLIHFHFYGQEPDLESDVKINVYRIACELINNALKHADATQINAQLIILDGMLSLSVQDNGKGFDTLKASGLGLKSVRSRAAYIGAQLHASSQMEDGSEFTLDLNLIHKS